MKNKRRLIVEAQFIVECETKYYTEVKKAIDQMNEDFMSDNEDMKIDGIAKATCTPVYAKITKDEIVKTK